ncbi:MAG: tyrosine-type recombinase/integrase [Burkholderiales bacterium]
MSITRHAKTGRWLYQFDRIVAGQRVRANKLLPQGWMRPQAQEFDRIETARLYALATGVDRAQPLIEDAVLLYLQQHAPALKSHKDIQGSLALLHPYYAGKPITALPEIARTFATEQALTLSPATVRNRLAYLRAACRWAWKTHNMAEHDPAERMVLPKVRNARHLYFDRRAMLTIARAMPNHTSRAAFRIGFYSGMRLAEILRARIMHNSQGLFLALADSKNGEVRLVPVHPRIAHLLRRPATRLRLPRDSMGRQLSADKTGLAITWPLHIHASTVSHHAKTAMLAVGLGQYRLHDGRHSAASEMINAGIDLYTVGGVLGHKSAASTQRYAHLATAKLSAAVATIGKNPQTRPTAKAA